MKFEIPAKTEQRSLYPERDSVGIGEKIETLAKLDSGEIEKIELSREEMKGILEFEDKLGEEIEGIDKLKINSVQLYSEYFLTNEGRRDFFEMFGEELTSSDLNEIELLILKRRAELRKIPLKKLDGIAGKSREHADKRLARIILEKMKPDGEFDAEKIEIPKRLTVLHNPEVVLDKTRRLKEYKNKLKKITRETAKQEPTNSEKTKTAILEIYKRNVNDMLTKCYPYAVLSGKLREKGIAVSENEVGLMSLFGGLKNYERNYSRIDKFIFGASADYKKGMQTQIGPEIKDFCEKIEADYVKNEMEREEQILGKGLDPEKIFEKNIGKEEFKRLAEEELEHYGIKSAEPPEEYDPSRPGPAKDNQWQVIVSKTFSSMAVNGKQQIIKSGEENKNAYKLIATLLGHEIEGHVFQYLNRKSIKLRIMREVGLDRAEIFFEGGAMNVENIIAQRAFGLKPLPIPFYVRAMEKRLKGGNYIECMQAFFESSRKIILEKRKRGLIDEAFFQAEMRRELDSAISSARRLFPVGIDLNSKSDFLNRSKDTVYLEQKMLADQLKKRGLEKYLLIGGINLDCLILMLKFGLLDKDGLREPDFYSLKVWGNIKEKYKKVAEV